MYRKAIVCTDLTCESDSLVICARGLRVLGVEEVVLTHVVDVFNSRSRPETSEADDDLFTRQIEALERSGIKVRIEASMGHPAFSVREICRHHNASLIVVGSHGGGVFGLPFSGSVSSDLLVLSDTPVFVASYHRITQDGGEGCGTVLSHVFFPTDFSEAAQHAFETLVRLVRRGAERVTMLHVQDKQRIERETGRDATELLSEYDHTDGVRLQRLRDRLGEAGAVAVDVEIEYGSPQEIIASRVGSGDYSLAVLGARGRSGPSEEALGGVSNEALRFATTPILIIPQDSRIPE